MQSLNQKIKIKSPTLLLDFYILFGLMAIYFLGNFIKPILKNVKA